MLKKYASVYQEFIQHSFSEAMSYRLHFILLIVMDLLFYFSLLGSVEFIFQHVETIGPWGRSEFMFFTAFMIAIDHLHMTFISESFWNLSTDIRTGKLDFVLLKPIASLFQIFFRYIRPGTLLNFFVPWGFLIYFGLELELNALAWFSLPFLVLLGLALLVSVEILISMSMFWTIESFGINFLRMQMQQLSRWPDFIYRFYARKFFSLVIPVLLIGSAPVKFLLDQSQWQLMLLMLGLTTASWLLTGFLWKRGLRFYESASS
ncbi:MAG: ABC transporter permease [Oligoflexus sp.]